MTDRYLYRAKRTDNGEWITGIGISDRNHGVTLVWKSDDGCLYETYVDHSTICQCTGLKDKNGNLILENDIVNCFESECSGKISWNESEAGFYFDVLVEDGTYEEEHIYDYADSMDVIGNIFDNPELLEVGK